MSKQPKSPTTPDDWDKLIDNPFNIGPFSRSMKAGDWWVITGMHVRLPDALADRPAGTSKLLVFADTISTLNRGKIRFDGLSDVLLIGDTLDMKNDTIHRERLNGKETFRIAVFARTVLPSYNKDRFAFGLEGNVSESPSYGAGGFTWLNTQIQSPALIEFYLGPVDYNPFGKKYGTRMLELPNSGPGFDACREFLARLLLTAQSLFDAGRPDDANRLLGRIETLVALMNPGVASWQEVLVQCAATREMLEPQLPGSDLVPDLSPAVYGGVARSYGPALKIFADKFDQFIDRTNAIRERVAAANLMLKKEDNAIRFQGQVTDQLEGNLDDAIENLSRAQTAMESQSKRVEEAERAFQRGLAAWRRDQQRQADMAITMAVFSAVASFISIAAGKPPDIADVAKKAEEAGKLMKLVLKIVETVKKLEKIFKVVAALGKMAYKIYPQHGKIVNARQLVADMANVRREADASDLGGAPSESAYWDQFWVEIETALAPAVDARIAGAPEYMQQLKVLIIYGRALTTAQAAIPPIAQELAQATLLTTLAEEQRDAIAKQMQALQAGTASSMLAVGLWLRHRSVRRAVFAALQDYDAAHRYWALDVKRPHNDPSGSIAALAEDLVKIAELEAFTADALKSFKPRPQSFSGVSFEAPAAAVADFLRDGSFAVLFTPNFGPVAGWGNVGRVRVHEVAAWVIWNEDKRPELMEFTIRTDGNYYDQRVVKGEMREFRFIGPEVNHTFRYDPINADRDREASFVRAKVDEDFRAQYSEPTLFTEWQFSLPKVDDKIDPKALKALQGAVKGIELQFWGTFIKDADRF